jgi:LPXTG-motif cell wall-anchored protein
VRLARAALVLVTGAGLAIAAQAAAPVGVPLYDGVVVQEPYRYLDPGSGQDGAPTSAMLRTEAAGSDGLSKPFVAATQEYPPQAQLIAAAGSFTTTAGAELVASIEPIRPATQPAGSRIAGNVYRFAVTDGSGSVPAIDPQHPATVSLRAPVDVTTANVARATADGWVALPTEHGGLFGLFATEVTELGDFALITPDTGPGLVPIVAALGGAALLVAILGFLVIRRRRTAAPAVVTQRRPAPPARRSERHGRPPGRRR